MNTQILDNSSKEELTKCITWQFEKAEHLVSIIQSLIDYFDTTTKRFWDSYITDVANIDTANDFGLSVIGQKLGVPRPIVSATQQSISTELYRKILKARVKLLEGNGNINDYYEYITSIFGENNVSIKDNLDMSITLTVKETNTLTNEQKDLITSKKDIVFVYPAGVGENKVITDIVFGINGQKKVANSDYTIGTFGGSTFIREGEQ